GSGRSPLAPTLGRLEGVSVQTWTPTLTLASSDMDANFSGLHAQQSCKLLKQGCWTNEEGFPDIPSAWRSPRSPEEGDLEGGSATFLGLPKEVFTKPLNPLEEFLKANPPIHPRFRAQVCVSAQTWLDGKVPGRPDHPWRPSTMPLTLSQRSETAVEFFWTEHGVDTESSSVDTMLQTQGKMMKKWSSSVDTESSSVDTMLQTQGKMMKKWSSGVDTESSSVDTMLQTQGKMMKKWSSSVDTRPSSQRTQSTGLYRVSTLDQVVSTQDQVVSTLETLPRNILC
ncbi:hypothetical protein Taro_013397, partial [Colocasia esculenta]|nr:hypothetical protein [Colocasia esculenta]